MSMTIYGGMTENGILIDDMVDNNRDNVYFVKGTNDEYFVRFTGSGKDALKPALCLFKTKEPFKPLWGHLLEEGWDTYIDENGDITDALKEKVDWFMEELDDGYLMLHYHALHMWDENDDKKWVREANLWTLLYLSYDMNYRHFDNSFYNNGYDQMTADELHAKNVSWISGLITSYGLKEVISFYSHAMKPYAYYPDGADEETLFSNLLYDTIYEAIPEKDLIMNESDLEPTDSEGHSYDGTASYLGTSFDFNDSVHTCTKSWRHSAGIALIEMLIDELNKQKEENQAAG